MELKFKTMKPNIKIYQAIISLLIVGLISIFIYSKFDNSWKNSKYHGIIEGIFPNPYFAGLPQIRLNNQLIQLKIHEENVISYIQIGDSIVKTSGSTIVSVFRKDENGNWVEKEFDCK